LFIKTGIEKQCTGLKIFSTLIQYKQASQPSICEIAFKFSNIFITHH